MSPVSQLTLRYPVEAAAAAPVEDLVDNISHVVKENLNSHIVGFRDLTPDQEYVYTQWLKKLTHVYELYGFNPLYLRPFERRETLLGDGSDTTKHIFAVTELVIDEWDEARAKDPRQAARDMKFGIDGQHTLIERVTEYAIPYDHTVPFARWVADHGEELNFPFARHHIADSYRPDKPSPGRFQAFDQADVDIVGRQLAEDADVDCICTIIKGLEVLNVGRFTIQINNINIVKGIVRSYGVPPECEKEVFRAIDKLDKMSVTEVTDWIFKIKNINMTSEKIAQMVVQFTRRCPIENFEFDQDYGPEAAAGLASLKRFVEYFKLSGIDTSILQLAPGLVRGLAYYTGIVFETFLDGKEKYGSVASGGRFDKLVGDLNAKYKDIGGVGGSIGLTRLFDIMVREDMPMPKRSMTANVLVGYRTEAQQRFSFEIAARLRDKDVTVFRYPGGEKPKNFFAYANGVKVPFAVMAMDVNSFVVKDMRRQWDKDYRGEDHTSIDAAVQDTLELIKKL